MKIFVLLLALFTFSAEAAKTKRKPANTNSPSKVVTFTCKAEDSDEVAALGVTHMNLDLRDSTIGSFSMSLYWKSGKTFSSKTLVGTFTTVPEGFVYRAQWNTGAPFTLIHLHPADRTVIPAKREKMQCEATASLESFP
jgi:hypothetical protein